MSMVGLEHFFLLADTSPDGILILADDGEIIYANKPFEELTGRKNGQLLHSSIAALFAPDTNAPIINQSTAPAGDEYQLLHQSGHAIPVAIWQREYSNAGKNYIILTVKDISRQKQLQEDNERLKTLVESSLEGIAISENFAILETNTAMSRISGYSCNELKGMHAKSMVTADCWETIKQNITNGYTHAYEVTGVRKDGTTFPVEICGKNSIYKGREVRVTSFRDITDRVIAEKELKSYEIKFQTLFQHGSDMLGLLNEKGEYLFVAPSVERILGYTPEELIGKLALDFIHPQDLAEVTSKLQDALVNKTVTIPDFRFRHASGHYIWVETVLNNLLDNKHVRAISASSREITERKEAEFALKRREQELKLALHEIQLTEQKLRSLFDRNPDAAFSIDSEGIITSANQTLLDIFQVGIDNIIGQHVLAFFNVSDDELIQQQISSALNGFADTLDSQFINLKGEFVKVRVTAIPIVINHKVTGVYCIAKNITESWQNEQRLRAINQMLQDAAANVDLRQLLTTFLSQIEQIYVSIQCAIALIHNNKLYLYVTPSLPAEMSSIVNGLDMNQLEDFSQQLPGLVLDINEEGHSDELREISRRLGIEAYVYYPLISAAGNTIGFVSFNYKDGSQFSEKDIEIIGQITKLIMLVMDSRNSLDAIKSQNKELQKINTELDRFAYSTSHELRAPLTSIKGLINLAIDYSEYSREVYDYLKMIERSTLKMENFILEIGDYYRNKSTVVNPAPVILHNLVSNIVNKIKNNPDAADVSFYEDIDPSLCILSDPQRLDVMLCNILLNAAKYSDDTKKQKTIEISAATNHTNAIEITIKDNGIGIAESCLPNVCNMFYRATEISNGSGLGLYIVKEVVNTLQGDIHIQSLLGEGTSVTVSLPTNYRNRN